ncbi:hypothetical protein ACWPM1_08225 [Tsuneonella sp. HG249]
MSDFLERQLREDRMLRDAARAMVEADVAYLRANLAGRSIPNRIADRIGEGAQDAMDEAAELAEQHRGVLAAAIGALILWFVRHPLINLVLGENANDEDE